MPKCSFSSYVLFLNSIVHFLSVSGWKGFEMKEWAKGSVRIKVKGFVPSLILFKSSKMLLILPANYGSLSTNGLFSPKCSPIFYNKPSTVVKTPPKVP